MSIDERHAQLLGQLEEHFAYVEGEPADELDPSLLVLAVQPRKGTPNSTVRIAGNPRHLGALLAQVMASQEEHAAEFLDALLQEMERLDALLDGPSLN